MLAWINVHLGRESGLDLQVRTAHEIEERFGKDFRLLSIGVPEVLVVLHRTNPTPYVLIGPSTYHWIEDKTSGGFEEWLQELEGYNPDVIAFRPIGKGVHNNKLRKWLKSRYHQEQIGLWRIYVKGSLDE
jgi:hypothetical protein